jgi:uncharacterized membrane protein (GlpM family)
LIILKLALVPLFLGLISIAGQRFGPSMAGWLAGLPVVVGPILFLIALEQGAPFARDAAIYTLASVAGVIAWVASYAWMARKAPPLAATAVAFLAWAVIALPVLFVPLNAFTTGTFALAALLVAPRLFPPVAANLVPQPLPRVELVLRMAVGAALTYAVTTLAQSAGPRVSGLLALFPVLTPVLAIFTHVSAGKDHAIAILRGLSRGLFSLVGFCFALTQLLDRTNLATAFAASIAIALGIQWLNRRARH